MLINKHYEVIKTAIRKFCFELECSQCKKKGKTSDSTIVTHDGGKPWGDVVVAGTAIPLGWISLEWLHRPKDADPVYGGEKDGADFCSLECLLEYFDNKLKGDQNGK